MLDWFVAVSYIEYSGNTTSFRTCRNKLTCMRICSRRETWVNRSILVWIFTIAHRLHEALPVVYGGYVYLSKKWTYRDAVFVIFNLWIPHLSIIPVPHSATRFSFSNGTNYPGFREIFYTLRLSQLYLWYFISYLAKPKLVPPMR